MVRLVLVLVLVLGSAGCNELMPLCPGPGVCAALDAALDRAIAPVPDLTSPEPPSQPDAAWPDAVAPDAWCGHEAALYNVPLSVMAIYQPGCSKSTRWVVDCMYATTKHCMNLGYDGGYGPVEDWDPSKQPDPQVKVICVRGLINALAPISGSCLAATPMSEGCLRAAHDHCTSLGYPSGFGPTAPPSAAGLPVACLKRAEKYLEDPDVLNVRLDTCLLDASNTALQFGFPCRAAIQRDCQFKNHVSGYGPVGYYPSTGTVARVEEMCIPAGCD